MYRTSWSCDAAERRAMTNRRDEILDAAFAIADDKGLDAVTMRAVAARIGVTAMALYPHVQSKDDLLEGLLGRLLAEMSVPDPAKSWQDRGREFARSARAAALRHPAVLPLAFTRPGVTREVAVVVDAVYQLLLDAGVAPDKVARVERMLSTFVIGYAISETGGRFAANERARRAMDPDAGFAAIARLGPLLDAPGSWDEEFEADLDDLIVMIESSAKPG
jgi:AcrR family transcriptional regulator